MAIVRSINGQSLDGQPPTPDRRRDPRTDAHLRLIVWGVDIRGERFLQEARAHEISLNGALLTGLDAELRSGDVLGILYAAKEARYRVVWVRESGKEQKVQAAVSLISPDQCPWKHVLTDPGAISAPQINPPIL